MPSRIPILPIEELAAYHLLYMQWQENPSGREGTGV